MSMKIIIITCHDVYNYGASLQAYALQEYIKSLGHDVHIIDYKPNGSPRYNFWTIPTSCRIYSLTQKYRIVAFLYCLYRAPERFYTIGRKKPFDLFKKDYLNCTRLYSSIDDLRNSPPDADVYIAGSDQIWNTVLSNGKDPAFYLNFGGNQIKRISYAASFAIPAIQNELQPFVKEMLSNIDCISVRELTGKQIVNDLGLNAEVVCDPVFLRSKEQWELLIQRKRILDYPYVMVYDLYSRDPNIKMAACEIAKQRHCKIVSVNAFIKNEYSDKNVNNAGPLEFLNLLFYSDFVVTDSFHASAFSVMFHKPFYVFQIKKANNSSRIADFLKTLHLENHLNPNVFNSVSDYGVSDKLLDDYVAFSKRFITDSIG